MKAWVYAVSTATGITWHVSLDMRADRDHWIRTAGRGFRLFVLEPELSFGQAQELAGRVKAGGPVRQLLGKIRAAGESLGMRTAEGSAAGWRLWEWEPGGEEGIPAAAFPGYEAMAAKIHALMPGRSLLPEEYLSLLAHSGLEEAAQSPYYYLQRGWLEGRLRLESGVELHREGRGFPFRRLKLRAQCKRCGSQGAQLPQKGTSSSASVVWTACPHCGGPCPYCEACLTMGRVRFCTPLIRSAEQPSTSAGQRKTQGFDTEVYLQPWGLSDVQWEASGSALLFLKGKKSLTRGKGKASSESKPGRFLMWAVTGAGKTEMIFPMIHYTLAQGGRAAVVTPRRDVVLELQPRLAKAFPGVQLVTLYGGSEQRWDQGDLVLATTHQLMRFHEAFDLVIIDEIDAYPYHNNPMLQHAAEQVCRPDGAYILLSATPPEPLQREVRRGRLSHARVAARFHRHPLPVPLRLATPPLQRSMQQGSLPLRLKDKLQASLRRGAQLFVFVPKIASVGPLTEILRSSFPGVPVEGTSSKDEQRAEKVTAFRQSRIRILVTTTILERGVTIPKSDVFILDADSRLFDAAALIQMAGRAGRSSEDPAGTVIFAAQQKTRSQASALRQIKEMNRLARKKGYIG
ncbi:competence protein ComFA [Paenibacillus mucilaginosus]|uniref:DEAD/DEAH box helicase n=1 Tax=Paenibacillus mucilaginosus TaxID=61624 RepID=UPI003D21D961